jgi:hypothetical protein
MSGQGARRRAVLSRREGRLATLAAAVVILVVASIPGPSGAPSLFGWDKLDHLSAFAALALLARAGWPSATRWLTAGALFAYGIGIELLQGSPLVNRTASLSDLAANAVGLAIGLALALWLGRVARTISWLPLRR